MVACVCNLSVAVAKWKTETGESPEARGASEPGIYRDKQQKRDPPCLKLEGNAQYPRMFCGFHTCAEARTHMLTSHMSTLKDKNVS